MGDYRRYAVYFAPRTRTALGRFGVAWFGRDAEACGPAPGLAVPGLPLAREDIVAAPRRYGFHGTLKAPFRLAPGVRPQDVCAGVAMLATRFAPFDVPLKLTSFGPFLALTPAVECAVLHALAAACVEDLDELRAPLAPAEVARRRAAGLTRRQEELLDAWGYPFVLDEFDFHLTLTGPLSPQAHAATRLALGPALAAALSEPMAFEDICLFGEADDGMFHVIERHALTGAPAAAAAGVGYSQPLRLK